MIRIAVWGAGGIAKSHIEALLHFSERCEIVAVCNHHPEKAQSLIEKYALNAKAYHDLAEALADTSLDAVTICLPPDRHEETVCFAAENGLHIMVEKPMANSVEECDRMIACAKAHQVLLSCVCQRRFSTDVQRVRTLLSSGRFGDIRYAQVNSMWWRGVHYHDLYWRGRWETEGGGVLTSQALHHLDLMLYILGMPEKVTAVMDNIAHSNSECEDVVTAVFTYPGFTAQFSASLAAHGEEKTLDFHTDSGRFSIPWRPAANAAMPNGFPQTNEEMLAEMQQTYQALPAVEGSEFDGLMDSFLTSIETGAPLIASAEDGRRVIEVISAVYQSAATHQSVSLPLDKDAPVYTLAGKAALMPRFNIKSVSVEALPDGKITLA